MDFIQILMKIKSSHQKDSDLLEAFEVFDREEKGFFRLHELEKALTQLPGSDIITESELAEILQLADPDGDGHVNFEGLFEAIENIWAPDKRKGYKEIPVGIDRRAVAPGLICTQRGAGMVGERSEL